LIRFFCHRSGRLSGSQRYAFRQAHKVIGRIVAYFIENKTSDEQSDQRSSFALFPIFLIRCCAGVFVAECDDARNIYGGTGSKSVKDQISLAKDPLKTDLFDFYNVLFMESLSVIIRHCCEKKNNWSIMKN
jgi:hypothetical protein